MSFKAEKITIDLTADFSAYIPGEDGVLKSNKTSPTQLFEWAKFSAKEADEIIKKKVSSSVSSEDLLIASRKSIVDQINWFYEKDNSYYDAIPMTVLKACMEYLNHQVMDAEKK